MAGTATRRGFVLGLGCLVGAGAGLALRAMVPGPSGTNLLRPPGARPGDDFLAACIRCGQCVEACPYETLELASLAQGVAAGTPYLEARQVPCYLCNDYEELLCITACPTQALQPVDDLRRIRMGTAVLDEATCLAYNGTTCRACWHACPFPNEALAYDARLRPKVVAEACIGCGLCDHACLTEPSSVPIRPAQAGEGV